MKLSTTLLSAAILLTTTVLANAETLRWARASDALTLDPHAQNESPTSDLIHQIMEPLVMRNMEASLVPALATEWAPSPSNPNVWVFKLRRYVTFHNGAGFNASDVKFSLERAMSAGSKYKDALSSVKQVRIIDNLTIEIETHGPNPIMPSNLTNIFIMDEDWARDNETVQVQDTESGEETFASLNANGTGPYRLVSRKPGVETVMRINENYWGTSVFPMEVTEIILTPIKDAETRVSALLSGDADFIQDVPVQDLARVANAEDVEVRTAPQNRVIFFGMNMGDADLTTDNVEGKNPFADRRVRRAMNMAIDRVAIRDLVMNGQSIPAGMIAPPFVNGWNADMDRSFKTDIETARTLMEAAGYGDGFSITLNCPNDRYINDEAICRAAVGMFAKIGVTVNLDIRPKAQHFPLINNLETDFYMLGWGVPTYDSEYIFDFLVHGRAKKHGTWNGTRFDNAELNAQIEGLAAETNRGKRNRMIQEIWSLVQFEALYIPIHHQVLNWGMRIGVDTFVGADDSPKFKYFRID